MKPKRDENEPSCPATGVVEWRATVIRKNERNVKVGKSTVVKAQMWDQARALAVVELHVGPGDLDVRRVAQ